jgi:hypothetical protein
VRDSVVDFQIFHTLKKLLTTRHSLLNPSRTGNGDDELDLLFMPLNAEKHLNLSVTSAVLFWLLTTTAWASNIKYLDDRLKKLRSKALAHPSLATFQPVPLLREEIAPLHDILLDEKDRIGEDDIAAFATVQELVGYPLETLDNIFDSLLREASALAQTASNEIQLIIGSLTIQVS